MNGAESFSGDTSRSTFASCDQLMSGGSVVPLITVMSVMTRGGSMTFARWKSLTGYQYRRHSNLESRRRHMGNFYAKVT